MTPLIAAGAELPGSKLPSPENFNLFFKIRSWTSTATSSGPYNPDQAFVREHEERLDFVRDTRTTQGSEKRRTIESQKIISGCKRRF
jgi:restriction endonuclease